MYKYLKNGLKSYLNPLAEGVEKFEQIPPERVRALIKTYKIRQTSESLKVQLPEMVKIFPETFGEGCGKGQVFE